MIEKKKNNKNQMYTFFVMLMFAVIICSNFFRMHFSQDTYCINVDYGYDRYIKHFLSIGRILGAVQMFITKKLNIPFETMVIGSSVSATILLTLSWFMLYSYTIKIAKIGENKKKQLLIAGITFSIIFTFETLVFAEAIVLAFSILCATLASCIYTSNLKRKNIYTAILIFLTILAYQTSTSLFLIITLVFIAFKNKGNIKEILKKLGASEEDSELVAEATIDADLKGFTSHGLGRFPQYLISIESGTINLKDNITIEKETPAIALINGNSGFGQAGAYKAMKLAVKKAKEVGIGCVGVHNSNHFGVTGFYSDIAVKEGVIGTVIANTDPAIAPFGASEALIGTNPIAIGIPSDSYIAVDMATSVTARGKILESKRKGLELPEGWALDKDGNPTTDPEAALEGSILAFGGFKGYALAFMIEILTGPLVNAEYGKGVTGTASPTKNCTKGDLYIAIDPSKFGSLEDFKAKTTDFCNQARAAGENVSIPGDLEVKKIANAEANGMEIDEKLYEQLKEICDDLDIDFDSYLEE